MNKQHPMQRGFTLIEVLVALSIIAIALGALINASGSHTHSVSYLKQKTLAHYVAMNEMALLQARNEWPEVGTINKSTDMAGHTWYWSREVLKVVDQITQKPSTLLRDVRFIVYSDEERQQNLSKLITYIKKPD